MKTEKEKMVAGEMYIADDEELVADRVEAKRLTRLYNEAMETGDERRFTLLNQLLGSSADGNPKLILIFVVITATISMLERAFSQISIV